MPEYNRSKSVIVDQKEGVATITLNRPERLNAIDEEMHLTLEELFIEMDRDSRIRAVVITGAGRPFYLQSVEHFSDKGCGPILGA